MGPSILIITVVWLLLTGELPAFAGQISEPKLDYFDSVVGTRSGRWSKRSMPLGVSILQPSKDSGAPVSQVAIARSAFLEWQEKSGQAIRFAFVEPGKASIVLRFVRGNRSDVEGLLKGGRTLVTCPDGRISRAEISIYTNHGSFKDPDFVGNACRHEIGHSLGLGSHSTDPHDIMYDTAGVVPKHISVRDLRTLAKIYDFEPTPALLEKLGEPCDHICPPPEPFDIERAVDGTGLSSYYDALRAHLGKQDFRAGAERGLDCTLRFLVDKNGSISDFSVEKPSGSAAFDSSSLTALVMSSPLPAPPVDFTNPKTKVRVRIRLCSDGRVSVPEQPSSAR